MRIEPPPASTSGSRPGSLVVLRHRNDAIRHLTVIARDLQARMTRGLVEEQGFDSLRASLGPFLSLIRTKERPIKFIAGRLGITKQACSQLAKLAEGVGYLVRLPDPDDRRSTILRLSPRGRLLIDRSIEIVRRTDRDYAAIVGATAYARFTSSIARLHEAINGPTKKDLAELERATRTVGALPLVTQRAQQELIEATAAHGHAGLKPSHAQIVSFIGASGVRLSDLARIHAVDRRILAATARDLVALGYVRREIDPGDRRGAVLFLTDRGVRLVRDSIVELRKLEGRVARILGRRALGQFLKVAEELHRALHAGEDIFDVSSVRPREGPTSRAKRDPDDLMELAARLHRELGPRRSMKLAALIEALPSTGAPSRSAGSARWGRVREIR